MTVLFLFWGFSKILSEPFSMVAERWLNFNLFLEITIETIVDSVVPTCWHIKVQLWLSPTENGRASAFGCV